MDDTQELLAINAAVQAEGGEITLEAGRIYTYTDERWLRFGDRPTVIQGNGAVLVSQAPDQRIMPLGDGPILWSDPRTGTNGNLGHRIASADAGTTAIALLEGDSADYQPGDTVLIAGYLQQLSQDNPPRNWGWPPNFRFFEHRTVEAVQSGALTLAEPLRFAYDQAWTDYDSFIFGTPFVLGAPRVWRWRHDDGRIPTRSLTIRDVTFRGTGGFSTKGLHLRLERCVVETPLFWPTACQSVELIDCTLAGMELDKVCERLLMEGGEVTLAGELSGNGAGVLDVTFRNVTFHRFIRGLIPRAGMTFENCRAENGVFLSALGALPPGDGLPFTFSMQAQERRR